MIRTRPDRSRGVTLVELAVVVFVVALLVGTILGPLSVQLRQRETREASQSIRDVRATLVAFAQARGRLPCPDTDAPADGVENLAGCNGAGAAVIEGVLPWVTLGVSPTDRWGHYYRYAVTGEFTDFSQPGQLPVAGQLDLSDGGCVGIITRGNNKASVQVVTPDANCGTNLNPDPGAAAVVISLGPNGYCATNLDNVTAGADGWDCATGPGSGTVDEYENVDGDASFVARTPSDGAAACNDAAASAGPLCEFDDLVEWIPDTLLFGKLTEAGQLP